MTINQRLSAPEPARSLRQLVTADLKVMGLGQKPLERRLPTWLEPGETVLALAFSTHEGRWWQEVRSMKSGRLVVATDRYLRLVPPGLVHAKSLTAEAQHPEPETLVYREIHGIDEKIGRLESKLSIVTATRTIRLTSMRAKGASAVASVVRARI